MNARRGTTASPRIATLARGILARGILSRGILATTLFAPVALGQAPTHAGKPDSAEAFELLNARDREAIHPGDPLRLVGVAEEDNDFRAGLHALERGEFVPARVEQSSAYQRQLAMIEGSAQPDRPYLLLASAEPAQRAGRTIRRQLAAKTEDPDAGGGTTWIGISLAAIASIAFMVTHCRSRV